MNAARRINEVLTARRRTDARQYTVRMFGGSASFAMLQNTLIESRRKQRRRESQRLSTLIIRVKRRLNIRCHRPSVSF